MKILIVDDKKENLYLLETLLKGSSYEVVSANNGAEALEMARRDLPDMIIADILMPVMDGFTLCREWKGDDRLKEIPFIFYTATYTEPKDEELALSLGADKFIVKPVEPDEFMRILQGVIKDVEKGKVVPKKPALEEEKDVFKLYSERLVKQLEKKMLDLEKALIERKRTEKRLEHLNNVLRAIRGVNQLIIKEKKIDRLFKGACDNIIETRGYYNAWIAVLDESGGIAKTAEAGLGKSFLPLVNHLKRGEMPDCARKALSQSEVVVTEDPLSTCTDCPLAKMYAGRGAMTVQLEHDGKAYGLLSVSIPKDFSKDEEEHSLFEEVAGDIAFALYALELEEKRKQAQDALRKSEEKYRILTENATDTIFTLDTKGKFTYLNPEIEKITGHPVQGLIGHPFTEVLAPEYIESTVARFRRGISGEAIPIYAVELLHKDGKKVPVELNITSLLDADGKTVGRIGIARNITERKRAEEALRESESNYRALINGMSDTVWVIDFDANFIDVNDAAVEVLGYSRKELLSMGPKDIDTSIGVEEIKGLIEQITADKIQVFETTHTTKDGKTIPVEVKSSLVNYQRKQMILSIARDITERKQAEEEKKKLQAQLQQAQKMEAIGTLAGGIAHDFNNILSAVIGYSELAKMKVPKGSDFISDLDEVLKAGNRAKNLVQQILTFSRQGEEEKKPVQIHLIAKEALKLLRPSLPTTIEIRQNIASTATVLADPTQIHQVIMNLCTNAYHAMREKGGVLEVSLADVELDFDFTARHLDTHLGPYIRLTVSDTGYGIEKKDIDKIFEPYFTTKEKGEGTGMGLAVVHGIVKSYGGAMTVYSEPGKGTTFHVFLPRIEREVPAEPESRLGKIPTGNERILFIDDEPAIVDIGKRMLERLGYEVEVRTSPIEPLEAFKAQPDKFDLVITDMTMPKMTGDELAKELMAIRPDIPIILCTGFSELINEEKAKAMGIRRLVMKPFVMRDLANTIRKVLDQEREK